MITPSEFKDTTSVKSNFHSEDQMVIQRSPIIRKTEKRTSEPNENEVVISLEENFLNNEFQNRNSVARSEVASSLSKKGLLSESAPDKNNLQSNSKSDDALFEPSIASGCIPLKVHFYNKLTTFDSCHWTFGAGCVFSEWLFRFTRRS